jgi:beta-lactam-binding protein with PASTA domain
MGYEEPAPMEDVAGVGQVTGGALPAPMFADYMAVAVADLGVEDFTDPPALERVTVPEAEARDVDEISAEIGDYDLNVFEDAVTDYRPAGTVVDQDPGGGEDVPRGRALRLAVSDGTGEPPEVPDVRGMSEEEARAVLEDAGYEVGVTEEGRTVTLEPGEEVPEDDGTVLDQQPTPGSPLEPGETVDLLVGRYDVERREPEPDQPDQPEQPEDERDEGPPAPGQTGVSIRSVEADPPGDDVQPEDGEHVTLVNEGRRPVEVGGWTITTAEGEVLSIGAGYAIAPRDRLRVYTGPGTNSPSRYYNGQDEPVLPRDGTELVLRDDRGGEVDRFSY